MSPRRRCQPAGASNTAAKRQNLPGTKFSRRNCQALHGWGWSNAIAKWQNLPGGEVLSVQLPSPAWLGIVECNCQVAKLARRRGSLGAIAKPCVVGDCRMHPPGGEIFSVQLPAAGLSNAADRRQNLPGGEVLSCYCQTMRERQMQPTGGKTCQAAKFFRRNCQVLRDWGLSNAADRRQTCQVKKFPYLPRWQPAVACVHAFPCLQGCFLVLRAVSSLRQSADSAKILGRSASVSVKAAFCRGKTGCMAGFLVRQLGARRVARANFQKYTQIT